MGIIGYTNGDYIPILVTNNNWWPEACACENWVCYNSNLLILYDKHFYLNHNLYKVKQHIPPNQLAGSFLFLIELYAYFDSYAVVYWTLLSYSQTCAIILKNDPVR